MGMAADAVLWTAPEPIEETGRTDSGAGMDSARHSFALQNNAAGNHSIALRLDKWGRCCLCQRRQCCPELANLISVLL